MLSAPPAAKPATVSPAPPAGPGSALQARLTGFAGFLRANGFALGAADSIRVLDTAQRCGVFERHVSAVEPEGAALRPGR